jgi:cytidylate kinase
MSVVAISETTGSLGVEIGRLAAAALGYEFADRAIITKAAERFGEAPTDLAHATEEKPTLWDRFRESQRRYVTYVEAIVLEMAAADNHVLIGRGAAIVLARFPHVLRVRVSAPPAERARRVEQSHGLVPDAAVDHVEHSDADHAARLRFFYHLDWNDPLLYDLAINTERISAPRAARLIVETLAEERFQPTPAVRKAIADESLAALARGALLRSPITRTKPIAVRCADGAVALTGNVDSVEERAAAEQAVRGIAGVRTVSNEILVLRPIRAAGV